MEKLNYKNESTEKKIHRNAKEPSFKSRKIVF